MTHKTITRTAVVRHFPGLRVLRVYPYGNCGSCRHLRQVHRHRRPPVLACCWRQSPTRWTWARVDRLHRCPLAENQEAAA